MKKPQPQKEVSLTVVGRRIMVAPAEPDLVTEAGLTLTEAPHRQPILGIILGVGPKVLERHPKLRPGVAVYYPASTGITVVVNGQPVVFMRPDQLIGLAVPGVIGQAEPLDQAA